MDGFGGPFFKRLTATDVGAGRAKISGPTLLADIRDFFPSPAGARDAVPVRALLVDEGGRRPDVLGTVPARIQIQGSGRKSAETILSDISVLRSRCEKGDILLLEPSLRQTDLVRVTRVGRLSPRWATLDHEIGKQDAGLLRGGVLPRQRLEGRLRARAGSGEIVKGDFSVSETSSGVEITFESGDGNGRNPRYRKAVALVLERLAGVGATLVGARISSRTLPADVPPSFSVRRFPFPVALAGVDDPAALAKALGTAGSRVGTLSDQKGSATRRMTLSLEFPARTGDLKALEEVLAGCRIWPPTGSSRTRRAVVLEPDLGVVDRAWDVWTASLEGASRPLGSGLRWLDEAAVAYTSSPSGKRSGRPDIHLGVRPEGAPWSVSIHAPRLAADANGLSAVGRSQDGRRLLLRQGWLKAPDEGGGDIRGDRFRSLTGLDPVEVTGGGTPTPRDWYVVADLDDAPAAIAADTADFVLRCEEARSAARSGDAPLKSPPLEAAPEKGGFFTRRATDAQPEQDILRIQGEVWLALSHRLTAGGLRLTKPRHAKGYEVDGVVDAPDGMVLLEIKTASSAAAVYEAVGQLVLYPEMLSLKPRRRLLLLAFEPSPVLVDAAAAHGIEIFSYVRDLQTGDPEIRFGDDFLRACGLSLTAGV